MVDQKKLRKLIKTLRKRADDLEDGNYHSECAAVHKLADFLGYNKEMDAEELFFEAIDKITSEIGFEQY